MPSGSGRYAWDLTKSKALLTPSFSTPILFSTRTGENGMRHLRLVFLLLAHMALVAPASA